MDRKEITAFLIDCDQDDFMAYADLGEAGTVVVGPDGKKFRFSNEELARMKEKKDAAKAVATPKKKSPAKKEPVKGTIPWTASDEPKKKRAPAKRAVTTSKKKPRKKEPTARKTA